MTKPKTHADELRGLAARDSASWDYVQSAMRSAADELDRRERVAEQAVHDAITRALAEAGIKQEVLVGMCIEVGLEAFREALGCAAEPSRALEDAARYRKLRGHGVIFDRGEPGDGARRVFGAGLDERVDKL